MIESHDRPLASDEEEISLRPTIRRCSRSSDDPTVLPQPCSCISLAYLASNGIFVEGEKRVEHAEDGYADPFGSSLPHVGYGFGPLDIPFEDYLQYPFFAQGSMMMPAVSLDSISCSSVCGEKWDLVAGQKYCESHIHGGGNSSRKPVEISNTNGCWRIPCSRVSPSAWKESAASPYLLGN